MRINKGGWLLGGRYIPPTRIQSQHTNYSSSSSWAFTYPATPTQGNFLFIVLGGIQARTTTMPVGWTVLDPLQTLNGSNTHLYAYKIAGAFESGFNVTFNASLQGTINYYELSDVDSSAGFLISDVSVNQTGSTYTSAASNVFNINRPAFVVTASLWSDTVTFTVNNSFSPVSVTGRALTAYRKYTAPISGEQVTWSKISGTDPTATKVNIIQIYGRKV